MTQPKIKASALDTGSGANKVVATDGTGKVPFEGPLTISVNTSDPAVRITQTGAGNALVIEDSTNPDSSPVVFDGAGNVVIGKTTSDASFGVLQVHTTTDFPLGVASFTATADPSIVYVSKSRGATVGTQTVLQSSDIIGSVRFQGSDGTNFIRAAQIDVVVDGTPGGNDMPGRLVFSTTADGSNTPTERMRISSTGLITLSGVSVPSYIDATTVSTTSTFSYDPVTHGQVAKVTLTNAITVTFGAPSNITPGAMYKFLLAAGDASARSFAWTGFRVATLIVKRVDAVSGWYIWDETRNQFNAVTNSLYFHSTQIENTATAPVDFLGNGFKIRSGPGTGVNDGGGQYIYLAFADAPFKYATAR